MECLKLLFTPLRVVNFFSKAKSFLEEKGVKFREITVSPNTADWEEMVRKTGSTSVPQIIISGEVVGWYNDLTNLDADGLLDEKLGLKREKPAPFSMT